MCSVVPEDLCPAHFPGQWAQICPSGNKSVYGKLREDFFILTLLDDAL